MLLQSRTSVAVGDIDPAFEDVVRIARFVAWDIETSGLDWRLDQIGTCQLHVKGQGTQIIRMEKGVVPERLRQLLISERVRKVFHHAPFDLRFMRYQWNASPRNVACTKVLSKLVNPNFEPQQHSLKPVLKKYLGIDLDKGQQVSDWLSRDLTNEQLEYAAKDVEYLLPLFELLMSDARSHGVADLAEASFAYLPVRIETDIMGCSDVFAY
jgi:ribonuclease D